MKRFKMKNDRYRKARGGHTRVLDIHCVRCGQKVLTYQKDGTGRLLRCYFDRILCQHGLSLRPVEADSPGTASMPQLICPKCRTLIGTAIRHATGRLAFRLQQGNFRKTAAT